MFRRGPFGYRRRDVDAWAAEMDSALATARAEIEHLKTSDPLPRIGAEVAEILRSLAESVAVVHENAEAEAARIRADAERDAQGLYVHAHDAMLEARKVLDDAKAEAARIIAEARASV